MKHNSTNLPLIVVAISLLIISAVCWHSLGEIHYLKSFFPGQFTVEEAFYASAIELIKIAIISLPFLLTIGISLYLLRCSDNRQ